MRGLRRVIWHRRVTLGLFFGLLPGTAAWLAFAPRSKLAAAVGATLVAVAFVAILMAMLLQFIVPCPRCGKPFFFRGPLIGPSPGRRGSFLASRCLNCGLSIDGEAK